MRLAFEWCGDGDGLINAIILTLGATITYPHKTIPTLDNKTLDKIKPTLQQDKISNDKTRQDFLSSLLAMYMLST